MLANSKVDKFGFGFNWAVWGFGFFMDFEEHKGFIAFGPCAFLYDKSGV